MRSHRPISAVPGTAAALVAVGLVLPSGRPASAQTADSDGDVRVIEMVDPVSGARYRQAVYDLEKGEIKAVQRALREAGYIGVGWTGRMDPGTVRALDELQEERGLFQCGCVSYETIVALGLKPAVEATTVAVGAASAGSYVTEDSYRYGIRSGVLYPVAVPILVPPDPDDPDDPDGEGPPVGTPGSPAPTYPPAGATPPGVRPLPPPSRIRP